MIKKVLYCPWIRLGIQSFLFSFVCWAFATMKIAKNVENCPTVAIKIMDKVMIRRYKTSWEDEERDI
jgi:hypothetical protein